MTRQARTGLVLMLCGIGLVGLAAGCSSTQAEPLEVTYYYLPG